MARKKNMFNVQIDPEFEKLIDPLSDEEYNQLKDNIRDYGLQEKILVWREPKTDIDLIVDGHNRYHVLIELSQESDEFEITDDFFTYGNAIFFTRDEVKEYMIKNQLGRRNLTREQKLRYIGQLQQSRKKSRGGDRKSEKSKVQNEPLIEKSTAAQIAEEVGVSESTVKRAEKFSAGIDALEKVSKEAAGKVLKGKASVSDTDVANFPKLGTDEQKTFVATVINNEKPIRTFVKTGDGPTVPEPMAYEAKLSYSVSKHKNENDNKAAITAQEHLKNLYKTAQLFELMGQPEPENDDEGCDAFLQETDNIANTILFFASTYDIPLGDMVFKKKKDCFGKKRYSVLIPQKK